MLHSFVLSLCRIQGRALQGSQEQPHRAAVDEGLVKDLVEGQVSLAAALRQDHILPCQLLFAACLHCAQKMPESICMSVHDLQPACFYCANINALVVLLFRVPYAQGFSGAGVTATTTLSHTHTL